MESDELKQLVQPRTERDAQIERQSKLLELYHLANRQKTLSATARVIVEGLRTFGFDRAGVFAHTSEDEFVHGLWGTDLEGNVFENRDEILPKESLPPTHGYYLDVAESVPNAPSRTDLAGVFLLQAQDEDRFESMWGYPPPCTGYYCRSDRGEGIALCVTAEEQRIGIIAVDNYITKRPIDQVSANLLSVTATYLTQALANATLRDLLARSELKSRALLDAVPDLIFSISGDGIFLDYKGDKADLMLPPQAFLGKSVHEVLPESVADNVMKHVELALRTGEMQAYEYQLQVPSPHGHLRDFEARTVISEKDETLTIVRDITERKQNQDELAEAYSQGRLEIVETILHNIGNAVNSLSIGVKTIQRNLSKNPLTYHFCALANAVKANQENFVEYVRDNPQGKKVAPFILSLAEDFSKRDEELMQTVDRVWGRVEYIAEVIHSQKIQGKRRTYTKSINMEKTLNDATGILQESISRRDIRLTVDCDNAPQELTMQESLFYQMIVNLVKNSIEAIDEQVNSTSSLREGLINGPPFIKIKCYAKSNSLFVEVSDNGIGIEPDQCQSIFRPGYTTKPSGTGLGLHSIANFVKESNGQVRALSEGKGRGTTVQVVLPLLPSLKMKLET